MTLHARYRFVCRICKRRISGCPESCPEPAHVIEEVDCCAVCAKAPKEAE